MSEQITSTATTVQPSPYSWLQAALPGSYPTPEEMGWAQVSIAELIEYIEAHGSQPLHFDTETTGLKYWLPDFRCVSISLYTEGSVPVACDLRSASPEEISSLLQSLRGKKLYAFNMAFDGAVLFAMNRQLKRKLRIGDEELLDALACCSQTLFRHCANEGQRSHSLETAQLTLLGWGRSQKDWLKEALAEEGLDKGDMSRLLETRHAEGFLFYNAADAYASHCVFTHLCKEIDRLGIGERMWQFHKREFACLIRDIIWQSFEGVKLDKKAMKEVLVNEYTKMVETQEAIRRHPLIAPKLEEFEWQRITAALRIETLTSYKQLTPQKIVADALAEYGKLDAEEPIAEEHEPILGSILGAQGKPLFLPGKGLVTPQLQVKIKFNKKWPGFSFASPDDMRIMLYEWLGRAEPASITIKGYRREGFNITFQDRVVFVPPTDGGAIPTGADVYPIFGEVGALIEKAAEHETMYGFAKSYLAAASDDGKIHWQLKPHGATTGRCSGGSGDKSSKATGGTSVNPQQLPKTHEAFMRCFQAPKGYEFISRDFNSLEMVVQAELSGDPTLSKLYASEEAHDVHLYHAMFIHPNKTVRESVKARYSTSKAILKELKTAFYKERTDTKGWGFGLAYNMGPFKMMCQANIQGSPMTFEEAQQIWNLYHGLYDVFYKWGETHKEEWAFRNGWIEDGFGFPIGIDGRWVDRMGYPKALRESASKIVQRTGHYVLLCWLKHIHAVKKEKGAWGKEIPIICDLHDERISMCKVEDRALIDEMQEEALRRVNLELAPNIHFKLTPAYGPTLWDVKKPD